MYFLKNTTHLATKDGMAKRILASIAWLDLLGWIGEQRLVTRSSCPNHYSLRFNRPIKMPSVRRKVILSPVNCGVKNSKTAWGA